MPFRDDSTTVLPLTVAPGDQAAMLAAARAMVPEWADCTRAEVSVVGGGITNQLHRLRAAGRPTLLVRTYGRNTELVIDREAENRLFARLSRVGFAPPYLGRFENGRIEGFLDGYRALQPHELAQPRLQQLIAHELAAMHAIPPAAAGAGRPQPRTWQTLRRWLHTAATLHFDDPQRQQQQAALDLPAHQALFQRLEQHWQQSLLPAASSPGLRAAVRPVLAHNDLLSGNVLLSPDGRSVRFIDYEYSACAPAAFDLANHFCEYAGFDSDFAAHFPDKAARDTFIGAYLQAASGPADAAAVAEVSRIVDFMVVLSHLWWGSWAVVQARYSPIDFDFIGYAALRLGGCDLHRRELGVCWP